MLRRVALVRTNVSEERNASIVRVTRIGELGKTSAVTSNRLVRFRNCHRCHSELHEALEDLLVTRTSPAVVVRAELAWSVLLERLKTPTTERISTIS
jgi:hypothetical protein